MKIKAIRKEKLLSFDENAHIKKSLDRAINELDEHLNNKNKMQKAGEALKKWESWTQQ